MPGEEKPPEEIKKSSGSGFKKIMMLTAFALIGFMAFVYIQQSGILNQLLGASEPEEQADRPIREVIHRFEQPFLVNMADRDILRYLKVILAVGVTSQGTVVELQQNEVVMRDAIIMVMSAKGSEDLTAPEGIEALKHELSERLNEILQTGQVMNVYFLDLVMQ
ncbi:MAG TPA: flagellar basal body-associated FliL family protein [Atribacteraceae bacterium]|nr:flagellar basal body-associated FliL family protein [Atribacteraceae bacterium]